jgi:protocatechuate 3,4-dioxygenase beta subunit
MGLTVAYLSSAQTDDLKKSISTAESTLKGNPESQQNYSNLANLITNNYSRLSVEERSRLRAVLESHAKWNSLTIYSREEPGSKLVINGIITDEHNRPIPFARIFVFQTDANGYYTPMDSITKKMGENDPRLCGYLTCDKNGKFFLRTIRPASYPIKYKDRFVPEHIHLNIKAEGYQDRNIQMVFEDDPAMSDYWIEWAKNLNYPVVKLTSRTETESEGVCFIAMKKK